MSNRRNFEFTGRMGLLITAIGSLIGSASFHWMVQSKLTNNTAVAVAFTVIFVLFPVVAAGFIFPTSPAGMLLMRIKMKTWGYVALILSAFFIVGYDGYLMNAWWLTQDVVRTSGYVLPQVILGIIGFHVLPGLLVSQVSTTEMIETIRQAHLVKRYKVQTDAELSILRSTTMRAVTLSQRGMSDLNDGERDELARIMVGLVGGIDRTMKEITGSVKGVSDVDVGYTSLLDNPQVANNLDVAVRYLQGLRADNEPPRGGPGGGVRKHLSASVSDASVTSQREGQSVPRDRSERNERRADQQRQGGDQRQSAPAQAMQPRADQQQHRDDERRPTTSQPPSGDQPANGRRLLHLPTDARQEGRGAGAALLTHTDDPRIVEFVAATSQGQPARAATDDVADMPSLFDLIDQQSAAGRRAA